MKNTKFHIVKADNLTYGRNVVRNIIALAAKEISGVYSLHGKGINMDLAGSRINVDVFITIEHGFSVPDVAFRVQENLKRSVETMTEYHIDTVNVNVLGVHFPNEETVNVPI